jgi:hypothetical protein
MVSPFPSSITVKYDVYDGRIQSILPYLMVSIECVWYSKKINSDDIIII